METQERVSQPFLRRPAATVSLALALIGACAALLAFAMRDAARELRYLDTARKEAIAARPEPGEQVGNGAEAFRRFRALLEEGDRFALLYGTDVDRDRRGFLRLFAGFFLYPAVAADDEADADAVMVFGLPSSKVRARFEELGVVDGVWLGRRRS